MEVTVSVNLNGLEEKLHQVGPKLARSHLRKAMKAGMKLIEEAAKANAPVDTGALRDSIKTLVVTNADQESGRASVGPSYEPSLKKNGGDTSQDPGVYGRFVEFGVPSRGIERSPFLRPAFDAQVENVVETFAEVLREGLEEATK